MGDQIIESKKSSETAASSIIRITETIKMQLGLRREPKIFW